MYWLPLPIHVVFYHSLRLAPRCPASTLVIAIYILLNTSTCMCHQNVVWKFVPDCVRSNLRGCKFKIFLGEGMPQTPLVGTHVFHTLLSSCYHPGRPTQNPVWNPDKGITKYTGILHSRLCGLWSLRCTRQLQVTHRHMSDYWQLRPIERFDLWKENDEVQAGHFR